jgi:hypothetical protein
MKRLIGQPVGQFIRCATPMRGVNVPVRDAKIARLRKVRVESPVRYGSLAREIRLIVRFGAFADGY